MSDAEQRYVPLAGFHYPRYDELPEGLMFLGDMVDAVNAAHAALPDRARHGKTFNGPMATNYMKRGLTPPAIGRRYGRDHLALVLFAATAKLAFNADDVLALAHSLFDGKDVAAVHDEFADAVNAEVLGCSQNSPGDSTIVLIARAFAAKSIALSREP